MALSDLVVVMNRGRIEQVGPPREIFENPLSTFVARFIGDHNVLSGRVEAIEGGRARVAVGEAGIAMAAAPDWQVGTSVNAAVRADKIQVVSSRQRLRAVGAEGDATAGDAGSVPAAVAAIEYLGMWVKLRLQVAGVDEFTVSLSDRQYFADPLQVGDRVFASWDAEDLHVLES